MEVTIIKLDKENIDKFIALIRVFEDVFEMKALERPNEKHLQQLLNDDSFYVFTAILNDKVVGGLTAYKLQQYYSEKPLVYIYDLAVKTEFQRQGIGKKLITDIINYCKKNGVEEVFVQADAEDDHAIKFYKETGATPEKVVHFYYPLNSSNPEE